VRKVVRIVWIALWPVRKVVFTIGAVVLGASLFPLAVASRLAPRRVDVGLGPEPLINNLYHKRALQLYGYSAETFVSSVYFITSDFDIRGDLILGGRLALLRPYYLFLRSLFRYRMLYIYFNGGPLMVRPVMWRLEPLLYRMAGLRVVVMPYGGDVQDMSRSPNLSFKHALSVDYPDHGLRRRRIARQIDLWTCHADHVISGVEWVDYMYHWDTLMLGHFSIDTSRYQDPEEAREGAGALRILHAPNHTAIKGTRFFVEAVEELRAEGVDVELVMLQGVPNEEILRAVAGADLIADQLVVGWYAMFALEALSLGKPVLCYLRPDLLDLYERAGLVKREEIPIINCDPSTVKATIRAIALDRTLLDGLPERGRAFVEKHHSLRTIGATFDRINRAAGVEPRDAGPGS
jgi:glycosyltransferase involved in cell wall biosynthesis